MPNLQQELLNLQNQELSQQLQQLDTIESNIASKDRIIDQLNQYQDNQQKNVYILIIVLISAIILLGIVLAYGYQKLTRGKMILTFVIFIVFYILLFMYNYNIFYLSDAINSIFNRNTAQYLGDSVATLSQELDQDIQNQLYGSQSDWVKNNCLCPPVEEKPEVIANIHTQLVPEKKGEFYYDGTAPAQQMKPTPDPKNMNEQIDWVDFSKNGNITYNSKTNTINYDTNTFYNSNSNYPSVLLEKDLNNSTLFTNDKTYTSNL